VPGEGVEHMVEKAHAGGDLGLAGAIEVDAGVDAGFGRVAGDLGLAGEGGLHGG